MANLRAVHSVGDSLVTYLRRSYPQNLRDIVAFEFRLVSSNELAAEAGLENTISLFLYRVSVNDHGRLVTRDRQPLALNLHYLLSVWADNPLHEHMGLSWTMRELFENPTLDASVLSPEAGWRPGDQVQLVMTELSHEDMCRIWDALTPSYRLSVAYVARVIEIDPLEEEQFLPVVARRLTLDTEGVGRR